MDDQIDTIDHCKHGVYRIEDADDPPILGWATTVANQPPSIVLLLAWMSLDV
jgi:hypothetical protein